MPKNLSAHLGDTSHALSADMGQQVLRHPFDEVRDVSQALEVRLPGYGWYGIGIAAPYLA